MGGMDMMDLPPNQKLNQRDAYHMLCLLPLEMVTKSLRRGDGWEGRDLASFAQRCRALADAYDARMEALSNETD